jgi:mxaA protein
MTPRIDRPALVRRLAPRTAMLLAACILASGVHADSADTPAETTHQTVQMVHQPRAFGYVLGDVLTQSIRLQADGRELTPAALPTRERVGTWLARRRASIDTARDGTRWLTLQYQIINAPQALTRIELPAVTIASRAGPAVMLAAWPISVGPLTPQGAFAAGDLQTVLPDRRPMPLALAPLRKQLYTGLALLALVLLGWLAWWFRNRRRAATLPFERAWRSLRALDAAGSSASGAAELENNSEAWRALHRAMNQTAGQVIQAATLPRLLARAPYLEPMREQLEQFYRHSGERFFAGVSPATPYPLRELCQGLRQLERQANSDALRARRQGLRGGIGSDVGSGIGGGTGIGSNTGSGSGSGGIIGISGGIERDSDGGGGGGGGNGNTSRSRSATDGGHGGRSGPAH